MRLTKLWHGHRRPHETGLLPRRALGRDRASRRPDRRQALIRPAGSEPIEAGKLRPILFVSLAILVFGLLIDARGLIVAVAARPLTSVALSFQAPEYFSLMLMAILSTAALVHGSLLKGIATGLLGVMVGLVGIDVNSGIARFSFGVPGLADGIGFVIVAMGLFAFAEIIRTSNTRRRAACCRPASPG